MKGKIFNAQEVQAMIAGTKTMFREVIKAQPNSEINPVYLKECNSWQWATKESRRECPYQVGQKIFCKERFFVSNYIELRYEANLSIDEKYYWLPAIKMKQEQSRITLEITGIKVERLQDISEDDAIREGVNKLFTEEEMKHVLKVHKIEKNDSYANYLWHGHIGRTITKKQSDGWEYQCSAYKKAKDSFFSLWNATHKKPEEKFEANPFVWVVDFKINK